MRYLKLLLVPLSFGASYYLTNTPNLSGGTIFVVSLIPILLVVAVLLFSVNENEAKSEIDMSLEQNEDEHSKDDFDEEPSPELKVKTVDYLKIKLSKNIIEILLALGIVGSFFLPWVDMIFFKLSAFTLLKQFELSDFISLLWILPISSLLFIALAIFKKNVKLYSLFLGLIPYVLLAVAFFKYGYTEDTKQLTGGFYMTAIFAFLLIVLSLLKIFAVVGELKREYLKIKRSHINLLLSFFVITLFFSPWVNVAIFPYSGYNLAHDRLTVFSSYVWIIPLFSGILFLYSFFKASTFMAFFTAITPFVFLAIAYKDSNESSNILDLLLYGGYLTLFFSFILLILTLFKKQIFVEEEYGK